MTQLTAKGAPLSRKYRYFLSVLLFILFLIFVSFYIFRAPILKTIVNALVYEKPTDSADVMIILSGDPGKRVDFASELYKKHRFSHVIVTGGKLHSIDIAQLMKNQAVKQGIPKNIILMENKAESTYENAVFTYPMIEQLKAKRILIVTSKYHSKRAYSLFKRVYLKKNPSLELFILFSPDHINYDHWWVRPDQREDVIIEWIKTVNNWF